MRMTEFRPMRMVERQPEHSVSAWSDLIGVFRQKVEHRWAFILASLLIPILVILAFIQEFTKPIQYHPPEVIFIKNWRADRSDAEIRRQQAIDGPKELADWKAIQKAEAKRRADARAVAEAMGIDVDR